MNKKFTVLILILGFFIFSCGDKEALQQAYSEYELGNYELAAELTKSELDSNPYNPNARYLSGCSLLKLENYKDAKDEFMYIISNPNRVTNEEQNELVWFRIHQCKIGLGTVKQRMINHYDTLTQDKLNYLSNVRSFKYK